MSFYAQPGALGRVSLWALLAFPIALPLVMVGLGFAMLLLFAALPTASAAYVLAMRMGGDGRMVAVLISLGTLFSALTIPGWLLLTGNA